MLLEFGKGDIKDRLASLGYEIIQSWEIARDHPEICVMAYTSRSGAVAYYDMKGDFVGITREGIWMTVTRGPNPMMLSKLIEWLKDLPFME